MSQKQYYHCACECGRPSAISPERQVSRFDNACERCAKIEQDSYRHLVVEVRAARPSKYGRPHSGDIREQAEGQHLLNLCRDINRACDAWLRRRKFA